MNRISRLLLLILGGLAQCLPSFGQQADTVPKFKVGGYADAYFAYYTDSVGSGKYQQFPAISPRSNGFGLNIAQITAQYTSQKVRSTITLHYGDLPNAAWSPVFNFIQEANLGVCIAKNLWVDAGFFKTHIGTEALLPKDNITSSVSMITFFEPWWQGGARIVYTPSDKFSAALYVVNGYNAYIPINKKKAAGVALTYNINDNLCLCYNNFLSDGTVDTVSTSHWRFLNNLVFNFAFGKKLKGVLGFDFIAQQNSDVPLDYAWVPPPQPPGNYYTSRTVTGSAYADSFILTLKYQAWAKLGFYGRMEAFNDPQGFMSEVVPVVCFPNCFGYGGLKMVGETLGIEYKAIENSYIRLEGREIETDASEKIFHTGGANVNYRGEIMLCIGAWF